MKQENKKLIKICGLNNLENIEELNLLQPDFMGFIFYQKSKRFFIKDAEIIPFIRNINNINKVGVFVNEGYTEIMQEVKDLNKENHVISMSCGAMECATVAMESTCRSKAQAKIKVRVK